MPTFKIQRPGHDAASLINHTRRVIDTLDNLGLTEALPDVRVALARAEELHDTERAAPAGYEALRVRLADALATGTVTIEEAIDQVVTAQRATDRHGAGVDLIHRAAAAAARIAWQTVVAYGDRLIVDVLRPEVDAVVDLTAKLGPTIPAGVTEDASAMAAASKVREAWATLGAAYDRWATLHRLADQLRQTGAIPLPRNVTVSAAPAPVVDTTVPLEEFRYNRPDLIVRYTDPKYRPHPALLLYRDIEAGAEPGIYTGTDIMARQQAIKAEQAGDEDRRKMVRL